MRVAFVSDPHVGNHRKCGGAIVGSMNERCRLVLNVLREAIKVCISKNVGHLVVNGDFFDAHDPSPQLIASVQVLLEWALSKGTQVVLLLGNHDMHSTSGMDNALAPLRRWAKVYDEPGVLSIPGALDIVMCPFRVGDAATWVPESLAGLALPKAKVPRVMSVHVGVRDPKTAAYLMGAADSVDVGDLRKWAKAAGISHVFAGNWHDKKVWEQADEPSIIQCGALCPTGWDNPGLTYGRMFIYDTTKVGPQVEEVTVPGPRFIEVTSVEEAARFADIATKKGLQMFVRLVEDAQTLALEGTPERPEGLAGWEVVSNSASSKAATADAAKAAKAESTLDEALSAYIQKMPLAPGVSADEVEAVSREIISMVRKELSL